MLLLPLAIFSIPGAFELCRLEFFVAFFYRVLKALSFLNCHNQFGLNAPRVVFVTPENINETVVVIKDAKISVQAKTIQKILQTVFANIRKKFFFFLRRIVEAIILKDGAESNL